MAEKIRKAEINDFEPLMRFLEKSYGHSRNYFSDNYAYLLKDVFGAGEKAPKGSYIVEKNGEILSHTGLYPIEIVSAGVKLTAGGIGNVATHPEARGRGYMRRLLQRAISDMEAGGVPVSVLWGDRRRYGNFGWETAGEKLKINFTSRSFGQAAVKSRIALEEVEPASAVQEIKKLHKNISFRAERGKKLKGIISRNNNRVWLSPDGYLCGAKEGGALLVNEVFSRSGNEAGLIYSAMTWCFLNSACVFLSSSDVPAVEKLIPVADSWTVVPEGMFRVNDYRGLLSAFSPLLRARAGARGLQDFNVCLEIERANKSENLDVSLRGGKVEINNSGCKKNLRVPEKDAVRLFLGGPVVIPKKLEPLKALLPLPVHIPALDRV